MAESFPTGSRPPRIDFVYFDAGGGHRSAATALNRAIASQGYPWDIRLINLQEVLDPLDVFRKWTGIRLEDLYNRMLAKGWTLGAKYWLRVIQWVIRQFHGQSVELLSRFWKARDPDMVVSLVPNLNRAMYEALKKGCPDVPYVGILTDLADYPPHFWMENQDQHLICGTGRALEQAKQAGIPEEKTFGVSGMILRPDFYAETAVDRRQERIRLGLHPDLPTGLVLFGGEGSNVMLPLCRRLGNSSIDLQLIAICGRNSRLKKRLEGLKTRNMVFAEGFTKQIRLYMHLSDFFIGKPGPGSISEALHMGLPIIIESNGWTLPQERFNAQWVREHGYGIVLGNLRKVEPAVRKLVSEGQLAIFRERISGSYNRAIYEIPAILSSILGSSPRSGQAVPN